MQGEEIDISAVPNDPAVLGRYRLRGKFNAILEFWLFT
jgi:hypothetical protein